jgi:3-deoxy-D-manno-octulosonic-acid transferase
MRQASFAERSALRCYACILWLCTPLYLLRVLLRGREEPGYRAHWPQRLGWYGANDRQTWRSATAHGPVVWVHAVSLGEARAASPLVQALRDQLPGMRLLLTHVTATGREAGQALLQAGDVQTWLPYDTPSAVRRFLRMYQPQVGVLIETEVWPTLQSEAECAHVPMVLANARLSEKSLRQGLRLAWLMRPAVWRMRQVLAQTPDDVARIVLLKHGQPNMVDDSVVACGNMKFDMSPAANLLAQGQGWRNDRPTVLAASTREGEEAGLLAAWQGMLAKPSSSGALIPRLLIVPRHPQRFDEVASMVTAKGLSLSRRSQWTATGPDANALAADVWLGDSMGEMPAYYACANVALLGGSFSPLGGQNLIEAAACACPIVMGPSTFNFAQAAEWSEAAGSAWRVADWPAGVQLARGMACSDTAQKQVWRDTCLAFAGTHRGAALRMAELIAKLID